MRERLAEHAHVVWQRWMGYMLSRFDEEHMDRWRRQANTKYEDLTEHEKESDRAIADEYFALMKEEGFVRLAEDQSVPKRVKESSESGLYPGYRAGVEDMLKAGFRKVELERR